MMFTAAMVALWLPPASAAPPRVLHDALVRAGPETVVHRFESGSSARYFSVVRVGGAKNWPTRETFVFARRASPTHVGGNEHEWVSFWRDCDATLRGTEKQAPGCFASSQNLTNVRSPRETNLAHNTALLWDAGTVYALGGRDNPTHHRSYAGVRIEGPTYHSFDAGVRDGAYSRTYETQSRLAAAARASAPSTRRLPPPEDLRGTPALRGAHAGCVEKRPQFAPNCEFDGRFSLAKLGSTYHLFARANLVGEKGARGHFGGRFVQSAASTTYPEARLARSPSSTSPASARPLLERSTFTLQPLRRTQRTRTTRSSRCSRSGTKDWQFWVSASRATESASRGSPSSRTRPTPATSARPTTRRTECSLMIRRRQRSSSCTATCRRSAT